jgi:ATP-dependent 26S proteasome regulatory subunit
MVNKGCCSFTKNLNNVLPLWVQDIRYELLARLCPNSTGAEIRSVCTEAGMFAIRARRKVNLSS